MNKILFCTDGSKISYNAIFNAINWLNNPVVDILCSADWSFLPDNIAVEDNEFVMKCTNSSVDVLNNAEKLLAEKGIIINEKIKMCGSAVDCILDTLNKGDYNLVILGSNGKKGLQKWLGSVSQEVSSGARVSTYVSKAKNNCKKILFAIDYNDLNYSILTSAFKMFDLSDKIVYLATVCEIPDYLFLEGNVDSEWVADISKKQNVDANIILSKLENRFKEYSLSIDKKIILNGNPADEIIRISDDEDIDLILCGMRKRSSIAKFLLSSTSKRILENSKSDVVIIRPSNQK